MHDDGVCQDVEIFDLLNRLIDDLINDFVKVVLKREVKFGLRLLENVSAGDKLEVSLDMVVEFDVCALCPVDCGNDANFRHLTRIICIARKNITWKRITRDEVDRYRNLLATAKKFCETHGLTDKAFQALDLSYGEISQCALEDASEMLEDNLLRLIHETQTVVKAVCKAYGYWFEINLQEPPRITVFHSVDWSKGIPKIDKRCKGVHDGISGYYEDGLCAVIDVLDRVLTKQPK